MKSVALLTSEESFLNNYGAALQGYALYSSIVEQGFQCQIVRYRGAEFFPKAKPTLKTVIKNCLMPIHKYFHKSEAEKERKKIMHQYSRDLMIREKYFAQFQHDNMIFYNEQRMNWFELKENCPNADIFVCGSDQIWNPNFKLGYNDPGYFLAFVPQGKKKIAYAPSFGCDDLPEMAKHDLKDLLDSFDVISVREASGVDIILKYAKRSAQVVLDPTLLRTPQQWKTIARLPKEIPDHYILCYRFAESDSTKRMIDQISMKLGLPVISLPLANVAFRDDFQFIFEAGPQEFVGLIEHADLVCTDSFHATVFSILMKTPICVFLRENFANNSSMNCRVFNLLQMLHLENLIVSETSTVDDALDCLKIDYSEAHTLLQKKREESICFLQNALGE